MLLAKMLLGVSWPSAKVGQVGPMRAASRISGVSAFGESWGVVEMQCAKRFLPGLNLGLEFLFYCVCGAPVREAHETIEN